MQQPSRGPAAAATNSLPATLPHHASRWPSSRRSHRAAGLTCAVVSNRAQQRSGADDDVQVQEQLERRALLARATATGRTVNIQCECDSWKWLLHGALRLCHRVCRELQQSSRAWCCGPKACAASLILAIACVCVGRVGCPVSIKLQLTINPPLSILSTVPFKITDL